MSPRADLCVAVGHVGCTGVFSHLRQFANGRLCRQRVGAFLRLVASRRFVVPARVVSLSVSWEMDLPLLRLALDDKQTLHGPHTSPLFSYVPVLVSSVPAQHNPILFAIQGGYGGEPPVRRRRVHGTQTGVLAARSVRLWVSWVARRLLGDGERLVVVTLVVLSRLPYLEVVVSRDRPINGVATTLF